MAEIDLSSCGHAILLSMVKDLRKRVEELEELNREKIVPEEVRDGLLFLFFQMGYETKRRWDQHLQVKFGGDKTNRIITWLLDEGILEHFPKDESAGIAKEDLAK